MRVLVTGGAGFIGSFLVDRLVEEGHEVTIFDNLDPQVHPDGKPKFLNPKAAFVLGDVTDYDEFKEVLKDKEIVFHMASAVGIGQSMYQIAHYMDANVQGISNLYDIIVNENLPIKKVLLPTSMSSYGEGMYQCDCGKKKAHMRLPEDVGDVWNPVCKSCGKEMEMIPTLETTRQDCTNVYSLSKKFQEELALLIGKRYNIPTVALRLFNVYGPRQSLSNPYTGVSAIFMSRLKAGKQPTVYEDGNQTRDFIFVTDVVDAFMKALQNDHADYEVFNIGSGVATTISDVSRTLAKIFDSDIQPLVTKEFRKGDVRHCVADISKAHRVLNWQPTISFEEGIKKLVAWAENEESQDKSDQASQELKDKNLL